jgi:hypothetical protein
LPLEEEIMATDQLTDNLALPKGRVMPEDLADYYFSRHLRLLRSPIPEDEPTVLIFESDFAPSDDSTLPFTIKIEFAEWNLAPLRA